jgi:glyoxylase-like metal-dependent hydrolase (beta-lactamase superfamily II)
LGEVTVEVIHTPGHTPGHLAFFFEEPKVLFMGDYDLTAFGPWYGDRYSSIQKTITSIERLRQIPARVWLACHESGVFEVEPGALWDQYLDVIKEREEKLLKLLALPRKMEEIVEASIVYGRPREPKALFELGESLTMKKHLEKLIEESRVLQEGDRFFKI